MKVILLQDVAKVGHKYDLKEVNDGFARNFLLGQGRALVATPANLAKIETLKKSKNEQQTKDNSLAKKFIAGLGNQPLKIKVKAGQGGNLFAALHKKELLAEVKSQFGVELAEHLIDLPKPLKQLGEHQINLRLDGRQEVLKIALTQQD